MSHCSSDSCIHDADLPVPHVLLFSKEFFFFLVTGLRPLSVNLFSIAMKNESLVVPSPPVPDQRGNCAASTAVVRGYRCREQVWGVREASSRALWSEGGSGRGC